MAGITSYQEFVEVGARFTTTYGRVHQSLVEVGYGFWTTSGKVHQSLVEVAYDFNTTSGIVHQVLVEVGVRVTSTTTTITTTTSTTAPPILIRATQIPILLVERALQSHVFETQQALLVGEYYTTTTTTTTTTTGIGTVCWGQDTSVEEVNIRNLLADWEGDGSISGSGDSEKLSLYEGGSEQLITPWRVDGDVKIRTNKYNTGDNVSIYYKTGSSVGSTVAKAWKRYTGHFTSQGFVDIRLFRGSTTTTSTSTTTTSTTTTTFTGTTTTAPPEYFSMESEAHLILSDDSSLVI